MLLFVTQELHDSLPSDPAEADLLRMAEAVADASDDADCAPSAAKRGWYLPRVGSGHPSFPLSIFSPFLLFPFFHWLYLFSSFIHPLPLYQNSPTPFSGRRS